MLSLYPIFSSSPAEFEGFRKGAVDSLIHAMAKASHGAQELISLLVLLLLLLLLCY